MDERKTVEAEITFNAGSRPQLPIGEGYAPHFVIDNNPTWLGVRFLNFPPEARFEEPNRVTVELLYPDTVDYDILTQGTEFEVREGPRVVAIGRILKNQ